MATLLTNLGISIHAPREGGDHITQPETLVSIISIHAPREGGDATNRRGMACHCKFQSTPPARGATSCAIAVTSIGGISIHAPREGGDAPICKALGISLDISIHAPREGGDQIEPVKAYPQVISIHAPREGGDYRYGL